MHDLEQGLGITSTSHSIFRMLDAIVVSKLLNFDARGYFRLVASLQRSSLE